jgi:hypothetical protein
VSVILTLLQSGVATFSQLPKLIILVLLKKLVGISILKIELKIMSEERESSQ